MMHLLRWPRVFVLLLLWSGSIAVAVEPEQSNADTNDLAAIDFFEKKIRPVLVKHCYECHSAEAAKSGKLKGNLQLDSRAGTRQGGDSGASVVPHKPDESLLLEALRYNSLEMPPQGKLPDGVIADFETWIDRGAADPRDGKPLTSRPAIDLVKGRQFWSLQPVKAPPLPSVEDAAWPISDIDRFILSQLETKKLRPAIDADPRTLLRRLSFDLTGLPPAPEEVEEIVRRMTLPDESTSIGEHQERNSKNPRQMYAEFVDRLLASPRFGERWGRHWLDVARFAESSGQSRNMVWRHAWRYRDYVIDAFNHDEPFDRFLREQIAGDLLPADSVPQRDRQRIATGFLALGPKTFDEPKREIFRMDQIDEQIDVISRAFLGLSVSCARCHDHKFDPIPTSDYYALAGILRSTQTLYGLGPKGIKGANDSEFQPLGDAADRLAGPAAEHLEQVKQQTQKRNTARSDRYRVVRKVADLKRQIDKPGVDHVKLQEEIVNLEADIKQWDEKIKAIDAELLQLVDHPPPQPDYAMAVRDSASFEDCRIHIRGETTNLGDTPPRGTLQLIALAGSGPIPAQASGRKQLADWLADPRNPLTPRVAVNRVWLHLFGAGLVSTPDDFGMNGSRPSHPKLLDYLAARFVAEGWSIKKLIREIVLSRTYQLSSQSLPANREVDPDNILLWRMRPRRLEAESFRDAVLSVSGQLDLQPLASSIVAGLDPLKQEEFNFSLALKPDQMEHRHRSVYLPIVRGNLHPLLKLFDFADTNRLVGKREETTVPAQSLYLLNSPWMIEQARHTAERLWSENHADDRGRLTRLYELALSRSPSAVEYERFEAFLRTAAAAETSAKDSVTNEAAQTARLDAWTSLCQAVLVSSEFRFVQ